MLSLSLFLLMFLYMSPHGDARELLVKGSVWCRCGTWKISEEKTVERGKRQPHITDSNEC